MSVFSDEKVDIGILLYQLENCLNLLSCFEEFVVEEGPDRLFSDEQDRKIAEYCFFTRFLQYYSMIRLSFDNLCSIKDSLSLLEDSIESKELKN